MFAFALGGGSGGLLWLAWLFGGGSSFRSLLGGGSLLVSSLLVSRVSSLVSTSGWKCASEMGVGSKCHDLSLLQRMKCPYIGVRVGGSLPSLFQNDFYAFMIHSE